MVLTAALHWRPALPVAPTPPAQPEEVADAPHEARELSHPELFLAAERLRLSLLLPVGAGRDAGSRSFPLQPIARHLSSEHGGDAKQLP